MIFKASAPGRISLLGEHGVLYKHDTLVCAVDKRICVQWSPRADDKIFIESALGCYDSSISCLESVAPFQYVLTTVMRFKKYFKHGFSLKIDADFSDQIGLASSASVTVATLAVLNHWLELNFTPLKMLQMGRQVVRQVQGFGSGADIAAAVLGGVIAFRMQPVRIVPLSFAYPITLFYSGSKTTTPDVVNRVQQQFKTQPKLFKVIMNAIGLCSKEGIKAIQSENWQELGHIMNIQQGFMDALGVSTPLLNSMIETLRADPGILGAKISGAGLGDCVIALGSLSKEFTAQYESFGVKHIPIHLSTQGVFCEQI